MMRKQHYMTYDERLKLEALYNTAKMPVAQIAKALGFCRQTIYNELKAGGPLQRRPDAGVQAGEDSGLLPPDHLQ